MIPEYNSCFKDKQLSIYQQQLYHYHKPSVVKELLCYHYIMTNEQTNTSLYMKQNFHISDNTYYEDYHIIIYDNINSANYHKNHNNKSLYQNSITLKFSFYHVKNQLQFYNFHKLRKYFDVNTTIQSTNKKTGNIDNLCQITFCIDLDYNHITKQLKKFSPNMPNHKTNLFINNIIYKYTTDTFIEYLLKSYLNVYNKYIIHIMQSTHALYDGM